jgi:nucleotide-binding universal stress UspA family protein
LLVTTTAVQLHAENETRLLSITATDTPEQTRKVLLAIAEDFHGDEPSFTAWEALQEWLTSSVHEVVIPYSIALARLIPPVSIRLRRDFKMVLNLIASHALLHQASRPRDEEARIIATVHDYAVVRELVADLIAEGIEAIVPPGIRETVKVLEEIIEEGKPEATITDIARHLKMDKSTASRRIKVAIQKGFINNLEAKKWFPAKLVLGDPIPEGLVVLPSPETLQSCIVANGPIGTQPHSSPSTKEWEAIDLLQGEL